MKPLVKFQDLGKVDYKEAWDIQSGILEELVINKKVKSNPRTISQVHHLLFCEHNPVFTLGKSGVVNHLLLNEDGLKKRGIQFYRINRGGDITYHGPGQITGYPLFDLDEFFTDIHRYIRLLEEVIIQTLKHFHISSGRIKDYTGVWIKNGGGHRKICAIGVHLSRWVTMHGFALNVNTDLKNFNHIIPCGISQNGASVTSMENELEQKVEIQKVKSILQIKFAEIFEFNYV